MKTAIYPNAARLSGKVFVVAPGPVGQFAIRSIPTLILFQNDREVARQSGATNQAQISQWLQSQSTR
jgi:thioredoxin 2